MSVFYQAIGVRRDPTPGYSSLIFSINRTGSGKGYENRENPGKTGMVGNYVNVGIMA